METYYSKNKDKFAARYVEKREELKAYWRTVSPEIRARRNQRSVEWRKNNKERKAAQNALWQERNPERAKALRQKYRSIPENKAGYSLRRRLRDFTRAKYSQCELFGCTPTELRKHLESQFRDGMSWDNYGAWHIDHVKPCALFDLSIPDQVRACFHFSNLQPLWATENLKKGKKFGAQSTSGL